MVRAFPSNRCYGIDRKAPALQQLEIDFPAIQISFEALQRPVNETIVCPLIYAMELKCLLLRAFDI